MRAFVALLVLACLIGAGFITWVLLAPEEREIVGPEVPGNFAAYGDPDIEQSPLTQVLLDPDRQYAIWDSEHLAFELEERFGSSFLEALTAQDSKRLSSFFLQQAECSIPADGEWDSEAVGPAAVRVRASQPGHSVTTEELAGFLLQQRESLAEVTRSTFEVLSITAPDEGPVSCRVRLEIAGTNADAQGLWFGSQHRVDFQIDDEQELANAASILRWQVEREEIREMRSPMFEDITEAAEVARLRITDNRRQPPGGARSFWFQFAVEDFDQDDDVDIAIATVDGRRILLRNDGGVFRYATKVLGLPDQYEAQPRRFCTAWIDYDNDGYPDLISGPAIFHNEQGKSFTNVTDQSGFVFDVEAMGAAVADYDADGLQDVFLIVQTPEESDDGVYGTWFEEADTGAENQLWRNLGNGRFENVTESAGVGGGARPSVSALWFFYDDDHYPDLYVANNCGHNRVYRNNGNGTFADVSAEAGVDKFGLSLGAAAGDLDNDGDTDVFQSSLFSSTGHRVLDQLTESDYPDGVFAVLKSLSTGNRVYSTGDEGMQEVAAESGLADAGWSWGPALADLNSDGWLDVYVTSGFMSFDNSRPDRLTCMFRAIATEPRNRDVTLPQIRRLDGDGDEYWAPTPFMIPQFDENLASFQPNRLFLGVNGRRFLDAGFGSGGDLDADSRSVVAADIDLDGALDLLVGSAGGGPLKVLRNVAAQGNRLDVRLEGTVSNRSGLGARVTAELGDRTIVRDMFPAGGFLCAGPARLWFGGGDADHIKRLEVRWPTGETQVFENVRLNQRVLIREGEAALKTIAVFD